MHNSLDPTDCIQRLKTLPCEAPPPYNWQEFQQRSAAVRVATDWRPLAAAAALLLFVCAIAVWGRVGGGGRHVVADSGAVEDGVKTHDGGVGSPARGAESAIAANSTIAANRSRAIEAWLASLPRERAVVRVGARAAVAGLEDRIAQVDDLMTSLRIDGTPPDRVAALQRERLRLVGSLAQVRYAEVVASGAP